MTRVSWLLLGALLTVATAAPAFGETTLEKLNRTGALTIGTRTGSPPFAFVNKQNEWVGFAIDLVEQAVKPALERKIGKPLKVEKKESTPPTRIPLLSSNAVDLIAGTMTHTRTRAESVDFSITYFVTGAQFLVKKGSPLKSIQDIAGKRIATQQGATNARILRERVPTAQLREFPDQPAAFQALVQGQVTAQWGEVVLPLLCDWPNRPKQKVEWRNGKNAHTCFQVVARFPHHSHLRLYPVTGRSHQLRVHCLHLGHPIIGDTLYNNASTADRLMLHAERIVFQHPQTGGKIELYSPAPFATYNNLSNSAAICC